MISVAVIGGSGFVGASIVRAFELKPDVRIVSVGRSDHEEKKGHGYDVLVNAAMPSGRFWAKNNPRADFTATVQTTADLFYGWSFQKFIQISTVSARCQLDTVYGRHKAAAEAVCAGPASLIVRLGPMYGATLSKGVLIDMLQGRPVFVGGESRYPFAPIDFVGEWIANNHQRTGLVEVGARDTVALSEIARHLGRDIVFHGAADHQEMMRSEPDFPSAHGVFDFLDQRAGRC